VIAPLDPADRAGPAAVRALLAAYVAAHDQCDGAALADLRAPDAWIADLAPRLCRRGQSGGDIQRWFDSKSGPVRMSFHDLHLRLEGGLCLVQTLRHTRTPNPRDPDDAAWWSRLSLVLRRGPAGWRIVHERESVPYHMDGSFRAAVNLEPGADPRPCARPTRRPARPAPAGVTPRRQPPQQTRQDRRSHALCRWLRNPGP